MQSRKTTKDLPRGFIFYFLVSRQILAQGDFSNGALELIPSQDAVSKLSCRSGDLGPERALVDFIGGIHAIRNWESGNFIAKYIFNRFRTRDLQRQNLSYLFDRFGVTCRKWIFIVQSLCQNIQR